MFLLLAGDPAALTCLDTIAHVRRQLDEAIIRLEATQAQALALVEATRWQTEAARRFREKTREWCAEVASLAGDAADSSAAAGRLQHRLALMMTDAAG